MLVGGGASVVVGRNKDSEGVGSEGAKGCKPGKPGKPALTPPHAPPPPSPPGKAPIREVVVVVVPTLMSVEGGSRSRSKWQSTWCKHAVSPIIIMSIPASIIMLMLFDIMAVVSTGPSAWPGDSESDGGSDGDGDLGDGDFGDGDFGDGATNRRTR